MFKNSHIQEYANSNPRQLVQKIFPPNTYTPNIIRFQYLSYIISLIFFHRSSASLHLPGTIQKVINEIRQKYVNLQLHLVINKILNKITLVKTMKHFQKKTIFAFVLLSLWRNMRKCEHHSKPHKFVNTCTTHIHRFVM